MGPSDAASVTRAVAVDDASHVGDARRTAVLAADRAGMDETGRGRVALAATELATNLARHAKGGCLLVRPLPGDPPGVELIAMDRGPGMDLDRCLADGFSTGGTSGQGLGAVRRIADAFDGWSRPGAGTVLRARIGGARAAHGAARGAGSDVASLRVGVVCTAAPGEERAGDSWAVDARRGRLRLLVVDGLGHGAAAADASAEAVRLFLAYPDPAPGEMLGRLHDALRPTRGAAAAVADIVPEAAELRWAGIGNIAASIFVGESSRSLMSHSGIVGHQVRRVQELPYPWSPASTLVMASDGVRTAWRLGDYPGLASRHPALTAAVLHRDCLRGRDDATVLVVRAAPAATD